MKSFIIIFLLSAQSIYSYSILIDPGHGGRDNGAIGFFGRRKLLEKILF